MKTCNLCKEDKELELFKKDQRRFDGRGSSCKDCMKVKGLEYYHRTKDERKEAINENRRNSYSKNKEKENRKSKEYKDNNKDKIKDYNKKYRSENLEKCRELSKEYYYDNIDERRAYSIKYTNDKLKSDDLFKLKFYLRSMIKKHFNRGGYSKSSKTQEILGCSFEEFKLYLESKFEDWMNWENRGLYNGELNYGWDIDHIIPLSSAKTEEDIIKLNHYLNLQPLCSYINRVVKKDKF